MSEMWLCSTAWMTDNKSNADYIIIWAFIYYHVLYFHIMTPTLTNHQTSGRLLSGLKHQHSLRIQSHNSSSKFNLLTNLRQFFSLKLCAKMYDFWEDRGQFYLTFLSFINFIRHILWIHVLALLYKCWPWTRTKSSGCDI